MPAGCKECAPNEWQCGSDVTELCGGSGGWTPAGALCLQVFVRKHPKTGNCLVKIEMNPQASCGDADIGRGGVPLGAVVQVAPGVVTKRRSTRKK